MAEDLKPLTCAGCAAPIPLGEADEVRCPSCGQAQPLPDEYRALREARRLSTADAQALDALVRDVATPQPAWKRVMMWVGYGVGIATLVVLAIGASRLASAWCSTSSRWCPSPSRGGPRSGSRRSRRCAPSSPRSPRRTAAGGGAVRVAHP